jgi:hypothetical protein
LKKPLGFGKSYFTLPAILAYSVQTRLQSQVTSAYSMINSKISSEENEVDDIDDPPHLLELPLILNAKPCYCNSLFSLRTRLSLLINLFIPRCPFYCKYFAFRRSGVHPPILF